MSNDEGSPNDKTRIDVALALARVQSRPRGDLERLGLIKLNGPSRIFSSRRDCLAAYQTEFPAGNRV